MTDPGQPNIKSNWLDGETIRAADVNVQAQRINDVEDDNADDVEFADLALALQDKVDKLTPLGGQTAVYQTSPDGTHSLRQVSTSSLGQGVIPIRGAGGVIKSGTASAEDDLIPKGQVDTAVATRQPVPLAGTIATPAATAAKTVTLDAPNDSYTPQAGDVFFLTWTLGTSASSPTLNINNTAAKPISSPNGTTNASINVAANMKTMLFYDGTTYWSYGVLLNTTYSSATASELEAGTSSTGRVLPATIAATKLLVRAASVPTSATATGRVGQFAEDGSYLYLCVATNTWRRTPLAAW